MCAEVLTRYYDGDLVLRVWNAESENRVFERLIRIIYKKAIPLPEKCKCKPSLCKIPLYIEYSIPLHSPASHPTQQPPDHNKDHKHADAASNTWASTD